MALACLRAGGAEEAGGAGEAGEAEGAGGAGEAGEAGFGYSRTWRENSVD